MAELELKGSKPRANVSILVSEWFSVLEKAVTEIERQFQTGEVFGGIQKERYGNAERHSFPSMWSLMEQGQAVDNFVLRNISGLVVVA